MYQLYQKNGSSFNNRRLLGEFEDVDNAYDIVDKKLEQEKEFKYVIEETTGFVDNYGELIRTVIEEN